MWYAVYARPGQSAKAAKSLRLFATRVVKASGGAYLLVNVRRYDAKVHQAICSCQGVLGFVGGAPVPMSEGEVQALLTTGKAG